MERFFFWGALLSAASLMACTNFILETSDGALINGRSMEFALNLKSDVVVHPRGEKYTSVAPGGKNGLTWTSKYGFVGLNGLGVDTTCDGLNEAGLSIGALWLPGTEYQNIPANQSDNVIALEDFGGWLLGNFKSTEEVKNGLKNILVWGHSIPELSNTIPPLHFTIHDASGKNIVVEFVNHEIKIHDNPLGVLTNAPTFDWHITNLRNYITVTSVDADNVKLGPLNLETTGHGSGLYGIPGDWTPPSRFVRAAFFKSLATQPKTAEQGVILAAHILNTVDIPYGDITDSSTSKQAGDYTQWIVIKDLKNLNFYYRDYNDLAIRKVEMKKLDFKEGNKMKSLPMSDGKPFIDVTDKL